MVQVQDKQVYLNGAVAIIRAGGWTLGNITNETSFDQHGHLCVSRAQRRTRAGHQCINTDRIAVGGSSSGSNLAAVLALKAPSLSPPILLVFQLLIIPVTGNTIPLIGASLPSTWATNAHTPGSPPLAWSGSGPTTSRALRTSMTGPPRPSSRRARSWPPPRTPGLASASATGCVGRASCMLQA
ncbi:hypothetical protein D9615_009885 [Tricholomella constricta]|uniref:Alpha/beta hydrolase fold-3 domain-containing protein n=1 Tax=Tricholomella constricta TaxID=117010 RepID=A0A8H5GX35_9AGAR|nr:hypothetical protein D9615_009885 [Tricholomella constricta]